MRKLWVQISSILDISVEEIVQYFFLSRSLLHFQFIEEQDEKQAKAQLLLNYLEDLAINFSNLLLSLGTPHPMLNSFIV